VTQTKDKTESLSDVIDVVVNETLREYTSVNLKESDLAISLIDLTSPDAVKLADFRGNERIYPASVVKLFYLVAVHQWLKEGKLKEREELKRALHDMIVDSSNDATSYVLDLLTSTTSGPELPEGEMADWAKKRNAVNEYFAKLSFENINVNQKTWGDGPFGRERIFVGHDYENRNKLTTNATSRLLSEIVAGKAITPTYCRAMMDLLARDFKKKSDDPDDQATKFIGAVVPTDAKLWSKAGWTSIVRHDAAYVEFPNGIRFVLVIFTSNHAKEHGIIPSITRKVLEQMILCHQNK